MRSGQDNARIVSRYRPAEHSCAHKTPTSTTSSRTAAAPKSYDFRLALYRCPTHLAIDFPCSKMKTFPNFALNRTTSLC
jgi:hypothetical protein